jgi:hypothetical protein
MIDAIIELDLAMVDLQKRQCRDGRRVTRTSRAPLVWGMSNQFMNAREGNRPPRHATCHRFAKELQKRILPTSRAERETIST